MKCKIIYLFMIGVILSGCQTEVKESSLGGAVSPLTSDSFVETIVDFKKSDKKEVDEIQDHNEVLISSESNQSLENKINEKVDEEVVKEEIVIPSTPVPNPPKKDIEPEATPVPAPDPTPTPTPKPDPTPIPTVKPEEPAVCSQCIDKSMPCDAILDTNYYREKLSSESEANERGMYYLDEVVTIGDDEITNYSVQPVYNNHRDIVYYGLNLWSSGKLIE